MPSVSFAGYFPQKDGSTPVDSLKQTQNASDLEKKNHATHTHPSEANMTDLLATLLRRRQNGHPDDAQLLDLILAAGASHTSTTAGHIDHCISCNSRLQSMRSFLDSVAKVEQAGFEEVFTDLRLRNQRERIKRKIRKLRKKGEWE